MKTLKEILENQAGIDGKARVSIEQAIRDVKALLLRKKRYTGKQANDGHFWTYDEIKLYNLAIDETNKNFGENN